MANWKYITSTEDISRLEEISKQKPVIIFKNSTRCSISHASLSDFERDLQSSDAFNAELYMLDVVAYRPVSLKIAEHFAINHQSPQLLLIVDGKCIYHNSHFGISLRDVKQKIDEKSLD